MLQTDLFLFLLTVVLVLVDELPDTCVDAVELLLELTRELLEEFCQFLFVLLSIFEYLGRVFSKLVVTDV